MTLAGTIVNGQVQLDYPSELLEGTRVRLLPDEAEYEYPHPMAPYDRDKEVALILSAIERKEAGERGRNVDEVFDELEREIRAADAQRG